MLMGVPPETQPEFGAWLRQRRLSAGLTQRQVAERVGSMYPYEVSLIENGKRGVKWDRGWRLISATQIRRPI